MKITDWAAEDRPREKMMASGPDALTDVELLAILIRTGGKGQTAIDIARDLLNECGGSLVAFADALYGRSAESQSNGFKHLGPAKICTIQAALELGRRKEKQAEVERLNAQLISSSEHVFAQFNQQLSKLDHEEVWALYLSKGGKILRRTLIGIGGVDFSPADIRRIVRPAIEAMASRVCLCHNHPHSSIQPSRLDDDLTTRTDKALALFGIQLLDHIIIADGIYYSYRDQGRL